MKMKCVVRPGGLLFLSVPVSKDRIVWNMHRIYGKLRLPLLLQHWSIGKIYSGLEWQSRWDGEYVTSEGDFEPLFVLRNEVRLRDHHQRSEWRGRLSSPACTQIPEPGHNARMLAAHRPLSEP